MSFKIGQTVRMSGDAIDNYGTDYANKPLKIISKSNKYMPAEQFYAQNMPKGYHPGYDEGMKGQYLYDFEGLDFSLYDWELEFIPVNTKLH